MRDKIKILREIADMAENTLASLNLSVSALTITLESLDYNDVLPKWQEDPDTAIRFVKRFPMYLDTLFMILESMEKTRDSLQTVADGIFAVRKKEKEGER